MTAPGWDEKSQIAVASPGFPKDDRLHVLFVIDQLGRTLGGAERSLLNIVRFLPQERFRCTVLTFSIVGDPTAFQNLPCALLVFPLKRTYDLQALWVAKRFIHLLRTQEVKIVHTFFESSDIWAGFWTKIASSALLVSSRRDMGILRGRRHQVAYRLLAPLFDKVLAVSSQVKAFSIRADRLDPDKVRTIYNGVDLQQFQRPESDKAPAYRSQYGPCKVVSTVSNIRKVKGIDIFVRAAASVLRALPNTLFVVAGDISENDYFQEVQELCQTLKVSKQIQFVGRQDNVLNVLFDSDVFCLLSRSEGFSNALLESMASGLPSVATRVGGNAEAIDEGETGFLVESEDAAAAADRIIFLLQNPDFAMRMGEAARAKVAANFSCEKMISEIVNVYDELLLEKGKSA